MAVRGVAHALLVLPEAYTWKEACERIHVFQVANIKGQLACFR